MPEWILSLAVLIAGLIGLMLGTGLVYGTLALSARTPWLAWIALLPALAVTLQAVSSGANVLGMGVIIGVHVLGILSAISTRAPVPSRSRAWSLIAAAMGIWGLALDGGLARAEGALLVLLCLLYLTWTVRQTTKISIEGAGYIWARIARVCVGLTLLTMGARVLAMGALDLALVLDLDRWMLGLALVAPACVLAGWMPRLIARQPAGGSSRIEPSVWFDFSLVNLLGLVGLTALTTPGGFPFTRETLLVSWPLVILTSILAGASLIRAEQA